MSQMFIKQFLKSCNVTMCVSVYALLYNVFVHMLVNLGHTCTFMKFLAIQSICRIQDLEINLKLSFFSQKHTHKIVCVGERKRAKSVVTISVNLL